MRKLTLALAFLLVGCEQTVDVSKLIGCYRLVNGPPMQLNLHSNQSASISSDVESKKITWSYENNQVFLHLPPHFFSNLSKLNNPISGERDDVWGYFGLIPKCSIHRNCVLQIDLDGNVYFDRIENKSKNECIYNNNSKSRSG